MSGFLWTVAPMTMIRRSKREARVERESSSAKYPASFFPAFILRSHVPRDIWQEQGYKKRCFTDECSGYGIHHRRGLTFHSLTSLPRLKLLSMRRYIGLG